jgi:hypothetical protein
MRLEGVTAIVSGAASGLGEATAREFASCGAHVVVADIDVDRGWRRRATRQPRLAHPATSIRRYPARRGAGLDRSPGLGVLWWITFEPQHRAAATSGIRCWVGSRPGPPAGSARGHPVRR